MTCELCDSDGGEVLWRDAWCRVVRVDEAGYPGYCRAIWNGHVKEMTDLAQEERSHFMRVVLGLEAAVREVLAPDKINLASLGNMTPHLHWHVIARFRDDAHFPNPIWGAALRPAPSRRAAPVTALRAALAARLGPAPS